MKPEEQNSKPNAGSAKDRIHAITTQLVQERSVAVNALAQQFHTSRETIRRDLNELEQQGIAIRTHGGAVLADHVGGQFYFRSRIEVNSPQKMKIGKFAARMVNDGDTIFLDASTTCLYLAKQLVDKHVTVITNSVQILFELINFEHITLISTGGVIRPKEMDFHGAGAEANISNFYAQKVFFSTTGFDIDYGATSSFEVIARIQRIMIQNAANVVFLCDQSKFGKICYNRVADSEELNYIVTDGKLPDGWEKRLPKRVKVLRCE